MSGPTAIDATVGQDLLSAALRNTRDAEVFWAREHAITAACLGEHEQAQKQDVEAIGLRVISGGRIGWAVHMGPWSKLDPGALQKRAVADAATGRPAPPTFWKEREAGLDVPTWDDDVAALDEGDLRRMARQAAERLRDMLGGVPAQVAVRRMLRRTMLVARMAERPGEKSILHFQARVGPVPETGAHLVESWMTGRAPDDPLATLGNVAWKAAVGQRSVTTPGGPSRVVLGPRAVAVVLRWLVEAQTGTALLAGRSRWDPTMVGRSRIVDERITVIDNPLRPWAAPSGAYDGEGLPRVRRPLIEKGMLQSLLLDLSTAFQLGTEPTASAARTLDTPPEPAPSFLELAAGDDGFEALLAVCEGGVYVDALAEDATPDDDGHFRVPAGAAFRIVDGRPNGWIADLQVAGNVYEMFARQILMVGGDRIAGPSACCGSIAFKDLTVEA